MRVLVAFAAAACLTAPVCAAGAEPPAIVTLVEGQPALLRGTTRYVLAEGVRLQSGDIVEVPDKGLAQVEFADGALLSLGPQCRFYAAALVARGAKAGAMSEFYLLRGWSKFALAKPAAPFRLTTPLFGLGTANAVAVVQVEAAEASMYVEAGELRLAEGFAKALPSSPVQLRGGQFYARKADQKGIIQSRAAPSFVTAMPRHYVDNLPARAAKYKEREVAPRRLEDLDYADVELWLKAPPALRRPIMQRLRSKAQEPEFRKAVIANMRFHPEWDRILFPEKYKPKPPPEPTKAAAPVAPPADRPEIPEPRRSPQ